GSSARSTTRNISRTAFIRPVARRETWTVTPFAVTAIRCLWIYSLGCSRIRTQRAGPPRLSPCKPVAGSGNGGHRRRCIVGVLEQEVESGYFLMVGFVQPLLMTP